ncbi:MAG TPA: cupin domain-containing protein, partial [Polyangiaceae bacterium]
LWDITEAEVDGVFAKSSQRSAWKRTPLPGVRTLGVSGGPHSGQADTFMVRFAPGMDFPRHRHQGSEALLVLEGSYTDSSGRVVEPGDLHEMSPGTEHGFHVAERGPCVGAVVQNGREFTGPFLKILAKVLDRRARRAKP